MNDHTSTLVTQRQLLLHEDVLNLLLKYAGAITLIKSARTTYQRQRSTIIMNQACGEGFGREALQS